MVVVVVAQCITRRPRLEAANIRVSERAKLACQPRANKRVTHSDSRASRWARVSSQPSDAGPAVRPTLDSVGSARPPATRQEPKEAAERSLGEPVRVIGACKASKQSITHKLLFLVVVIVVSSILLLVVVVVGSDADQDQQRVRRSSLDERPPRGAFCVRCRARQPASCWPRSASWVQLDFSGLSRMDVIGASAWQPAISVILIMTTKDDASDEHDDDLAA